MCIFSLLFVYTCHTSLQNNLHGHGRHLDHPWLKQKITEAPEQPTAVFAGRELEKDRRMEYDDIKDKGLITMASPFDDGPMKVYVKSAKGKTTTVDVEPGKTVRSLKIKIQAIEKITPCQQRLMFAGTILDDAKTLREYRIPPNGVISLGGGEEAVEEKRRRSLISRKFGGQATLTLTLTFILTVPLNPTFALTLTRTRSITSTLSLTLSLTLTRRWR